MICKKSFKNESTVSAFDKYEFDLSFADNASDIKRKNNCILVENVPDIEDAYNAIEYVNKNPGLVTISIDALYSIFNRTGNWKHKSFKGKGIKMLCNKLASIKSNNIFLSIYCDYNHMLHDYLEIIDSCMKNQNENAFIRFGLPIVEDNDDKIIIHVFYQ